MKPKSTLRSFLSIASSALLTISYSHAASATWDGSTDQTWAEGTNWSGDAAPGATSGTTSADVATFGTTGSGTITVDANRNISGINFSANSSAFTLSGGNLLLTNAGTIQTSGAGSGHTDTISSAIELQGDGGTASFTAGSSTATRLLVIGGGVTGVSTGANVTTLTLNGANGGNNAVNGIIGNGSGGGKLALVKSGAGKWVLGGASNSYSGGTVLSGGTLAFATNSDVYLGATSGGLTFNGGQISYTDGFVLNRAVKVDANLALNNSITVTGALTGSSSITQVGSDGATFSNANNTFTGTINSGYAMTFASLGDSANSITLANNGWNWTGVAKTFDLRPFTLTGTGTSPLSNNGSGALVIKQSLAFSSIGATKTFQLGGSYTGGVNTFEGNITNGPSSVLSFAKGGDDSRWALSGTNNYTGTTTLSTGGEFGLLIFRGMQALSNSTSLNQTQGGTNVHWGTIRLLDDSATPASRSGVNLNWSIQENINSSSEPNRYFMRLFVGNNSTANLGTSSSTQTGSTIQLGNLTLTEGAAVAAGQGLWVAGANGYGLQIADVNVTLQALTAGNHVATLRADNPMTVTGTVRQANDAAVGSNTTLQLEGSAAGSLISGNILDSAGGRLMNVSKAGSGTWTLGGTNSYTGTTAISTGTLVFSGSNSMSSTSALSVAAGANMSLADGIAYTGSTTAALTLGSGSILYFDWANAATDTLTSTAAATTAGGVAINMNRVGTPSGGPHTLISSAGGGLNTATYYLANNTDFTATLAQSGTAVSIDSYGTASVLGDAYWKGGVLTQAVAAMNLTTGATSNWTTDAAATTAAGTVPGGGTTNVIFGATGAAQQANVTTSGSLNLGSITFNDSAAVTISATNGSTITLNNTSSTAATTAAALSTITNAGANAISAISVTSFAANPTINAPIILGANQTWNVATGKTLTVGGVVSGAAGLTIAGGSSTSKVILNGVNTFTGNLSITGGTLQIGTNGGTASLGGGNYAGNIVNNGTLDIQTGANNTLSGIISGSGALLHRNTGTLTLKGANTYTGKTTINAITNTPSPTLVVSSFNSVNGGTPLLASSSLGAPTTVANGTIEMGSNNSSPNPVLRYVGTGETTDRVINFFFNSGAQRTLDASGSGLLKFTSNFTQNGAATGGVTLTGTGTGELAGALPVLGSGAFNKTGTGTWTLSGANAFLNPVTVSAGTLLINNTTGSGTGSGAVSVTAGTLGGTGTISGAVTIGNSTGTADSILAPGTSIGALATGNLAFNSDGRYACELNGTSATSDRTNVTGTVAINAATTLTVSLTGSLSSGQKYFIVVNDLADAVTGTFAGLAQDAVVGNYGGTDLKISYTGDSGGSAISGGNDIVLYTDGVGGSAYDTWKATNAPTGNPDDDFDGDGVSNAVEFVLGGLATTNDLDKLPKVATDGTNMTFTFERDVDSIDPGKTTVSIEVGTDLVTWPAPSPYAVPDTAAANNPGVTVVEDTSLGFDTVTLSVPQDAAKKFARLKVVITP